MKRPIRIHGDTAHIQLTNGYEAVIDASDVHLVAGTIWFAKVRFGPNGSVRNVYAARMTGRAQGKRKYILMHRVIAGTPDTAETDHIDGNGLNNRRFNLRLANRSENQRNQRLSAANTSGVKGVDWQARFQKWRARIKVNGRSYSLGHHATIEDAAAAYAAASAKLHGEFGRVK